ncbi:MAG: ATP-binding protein, partial [Gammaproteobacteria bacterium]|nr:ATP-binding protein [Gammaproteobacteria bacterium]
QISDRGPGIPNQYLDRIFEPFFRVKNSVADTSGSGLGLAIAQRAFDILGGSINALPRTGGGLTFIIKLPAADLT